MSVVFLTIRRFVYYVFVFLLPIMGLLGSFGYFWGRALFRSYHSKLLEVSNHLEGRWQKRMEDLTKRVEAVYRNTEVYNVRRLPRKLAEIKSKFRYLRHIYIFNSKGELVGGDGKMRKNFDLSSLDRLSSSTPKIFFFKASSLSEWKGGAYLPFKSGFSMIFIFSFQEFAFDFQELSDVWKGIKILFEDELGEPIFTNVRGEERSFFIQSCVDSNWIEALWWGRIGVYKKLEFSHSPLPCSLWLLLPLQKGMESFRNMVLYLGLIFGGVVFICFWLSLRFSLKLSQKVEKARQIWKGLFPGKPFPIKRVAEEEELWREFYEQICYFCENDKLERERKIKRVYHGYRDFQAAFLHFQENSENQQKELFKIQKNIAQQKQSFRLEGLEEVIRSLELLLDKMDSRISEDRISSLVGELETWIGFSFWPNLKENVSEVLLESVEQVFRDLSTLDFVAVNASLEAAKLGEMGRGVEEMARQVRVNQKVVLEKMDRIREKAAGWQVQFQEFREGMLRKLALLSEELSSLFREWRDWKSGVHAARKRLEELLSRLGRDSEEEKDLVIKDLGCRLRELGEGWERICGKFQRLEDIFLDFQDFFSGG
ncbi:MAG: hypothetical protein D6805_06225 [Planctomycetota bacterium]|nr:MAG: hypothetical protein D6805_06225 [Planctomycetota bacterium]